MEILTKIGKVENVNLIKKAIFGYFDENKGENQVLIEHFKDFWQKFNKSNDWDAT